MEKKNSRKQDLERTHQAILDVGAKLFMEKGFKNTSTREIAKLCNITQPNLYHHFKNKKEIYIAVIEQLTERVEKDLLVVVNGSGTTEEKLVSLAHILIDKHPTNLFLMLHDMFVEMEQEYMTTLYHIFRQTYFDPISQIFTQEGKESLLREDISVDDATRFVLYTISSILSVEHTYQIQSKEEEVKKFIRMMLYGLYQ